MKELADISTFQSLVNGANQCVVENGNMWRRMKSMAIPVAASALMNIIPPNYIHPNEVEAPETPAAERGISIRPEVQEAGTALYMADRPMPPRMYRQALITLLGRDIYRTLTPAEREYLRKANEECYSRLESIKRKNEARAKRAQEEKELEEMYAGKRPWPEVIDQDLQERILRYGEPY